MYHVSYSFGVHLLYVNAITTLRNVLWQYFYSRFRCRIEDIVKVLLCFTVLQPWQRLVDAPTRTWKQFLFRSTKFHDDRSVLSWKRLSARFVGSKLFSNLKTSIKVQRKMSIYTHLPKRIKGKVPLCTCCVNKRELNVPLLRGRHYIYTADC